jgi:hypothetical protein
MCRSRAYGVLLCATHTKIQVLEVVGLGTLRGPNREYEAAAHVADYGKVRHSVTVEIARYYGAGIPPHFWPSDT